MICTNIVRKTIKINTDKTKCMIFNPTGRLLHRNFFLGDCKLENVRSYKYLGLIFTPSGEIKSALDDLRSRALKAYMSLKNKLGVHFKDHIFDSIHLFDTLVKPILLYACDFWGCLKLPLNNPIENLYMQVCRQLLGVGKKTTNIGVLLELGRTPLTLDAQKIAMKNWERIKNRRANQLLIRSYENAKEESLVWVTNIRHALEKIGMYNLFVDNSSGKTHAEFYKRVKDIFNQDSLSTINKDTSKLRMYALMKERIGMEDYLTDIHNVKLRCKLTKYRLSNHQLRIETGR